MKITKKEFKLLSNEEKLKEIEKLDYWMDREEIMELLSSCDLDSLDGKLLSLLGRAYNNLADYETAIVILNMVPEDERDARWYFRLAFSHNKLADNLKYDFEAESTKALDLLNRAVQLTDDEDIINHCVDLIYYSNKQLEKLLENSKEKYSDIAEKYFEFKNSFTKQEPIKQEKKMTYAKFTVEDIQNTDDSWGISEPMWFTINIYDSYEEYIKSAERFTIEQRYLSAIIWYFAEVNNGGHHQFFYNSTGIVWEDALHGFKHFGMLDYAANFQKVVDYCGGKISIDRMERYEMLRVLEEEYEEEFFKFLDEADNFVYLYEGEDNELIYIKAQPEKFVFEGEYEKY